MRLSLLVFTFLSASLLTYVTGQQIIDIKHNHHLDDLPCVMEADTEGEPVKIAYNWNRNASKNRTAMFTVNYLSSGTLFGATCIEWPADAKVAFDHAVDIWGDILTSSTDIKIDACWSSSLGGNVLGAAGATSNTPLEVVGQLPVSFFPEPLAEQLLGIDNNPNASDINAIFNANLSLGSGWYFGTDMNVPVNGFDFVSVVLHELGHGLGFAGAADVDDGDPMNGAECTGTAGIGCIGFLTQGGIWIPTIYDRFVDIDDGTLLIDQSNPSADITTLLQGGSVTGGMGGLQYDDSNIDFFTRIATADLHTPGTFQPGSSYSHYSEATLGNELMSPSISNGQAIHDPGMAVGFFEEFGWNLNVVPVELISFSAETDGSQVDLSWTTASEVNNDFFEVEHSTDYENFEVIGTLQGKGNSNDLNNYTFTDPNPVIGINVYRLKQVDYDGTSSLSNLEVIDISSEDQTIAIGPNPFIETIRINSNKKLDDVKVSIYDTFGKLVFSNGIDATHDLNLSSLPAGSYVVEVSHKTGSVTKRLIKSE